MEHSQWVLCCILLRALTVHGIVSELQCNHDQFVCPLQAITYQCVVLGSGQNLIWVVQSEQIARFGTNGQTVLSPTNPDYTATAQALTNGISSTLSFTAQLQSDPMTAQCLDISGNSMSCSYSIVEQSGPPVISIILALNSSSTNMSWTPPLYSCSLTYTVEVVNESSGSVILSENTTSTGLYVTTLMVGETYSFRVASVDAADRMSNWSQPILLTMQVPMPVEIIAVTVESSTQLHYITVEWKGSLSVNFPPVSHYIVYHNVTSDGEQGIITYNTTVSINVTNELFQPNDIYSIQVAAVNAIGQGPVNETILKNIMTAEGTTSIMDTLSPSTVAVATGTTNSNVQPTYMQPTSTSALQTNCAVSKTPANTQSLIVVLVVLGTVSCSIHLLMIVIIIVLVKKLSDIISSQKCHIYEGTTGKSTQDDNHLQQKGPVYDTPQPLMGTQSKMELKENVCYGDVSMKVTENVAYVSKC